MRLWTTLAAACALGATLAAQAFDIKPGQWMYTVTATATPPPPASLPPAAAAKIMANARRPHTVPGCITPEDLRNYRLGKLDDDDTDCTVTSRKSTATTADFVRTCKGDEPGTETVHVDAASRESFSMTVKRAGAGGPAEFQIVAKWTGATCKD